MEKSSVSPKGERSLGSFAEDFTTLKWTFKEYRCGETATFRASHGLSLYVQDQDGDSSWWELRKGKIVVAKGEDDGGNPPHFFACLRDAERALKRRLEEIAAEHAGRKVTKKEMRQIAADQAQENRIDKQNFAAKAKAAGMKKFSVRAPNGEVREVWTYNTSFERMAFNDQQMEAAERFQRDYEMAFRGLRGLGFEPAVDGGKSAHGAHHSRVQAQATLAECRQALGRYNYELVVAVAINGGSARQLHALGASQHQVMAAEIRRAFYELYNFYFGTALQTGSMKAVEQFNAERAALIEQAERELG